MRSLIIHTMITLLSVSKRELKFYLPWEEKRFEYNTDFFFINSILKDTRMVFTQIT